MSLFWVACNKAEGDTPEIKRSVLVDVLVDIHITDGYLIQAGYQPMKNHDEIIDSYDYVLKKHNISPKQFKNTIKYYSKHLPEYERIYDEVMAKLTAIESQYLYNHTQNDNK